MAESPPLVRLLAEQHHPHLLPLPGRAQAGSDSDTWNGVANGCTGLGIQSAIPGGTPSMATYWWSGTEYYCFARRIYNRYWKIGGSWQITSDYVAYDTDLYVTNGSATGGKGTHATCASYGPCAGFINLQAEQ